MDGSGNGKPDDDGSGQKGAIPARRKRRDLDAPITRRQSKPLPDFTGLTPLTEEVHGGYTEFLPAAQQIVVTPPSRRRRILAYGLCAVATVAIIGAIVSHLRIFAIAAGEVQAHGGSQVVEPLEGGQISAIPIKNGDHVRKNDVVLQIDPTAAQAAKTIIEAKLADARAELIRRRTATVAAKSPVIDKNVPVTWSDDIPADVRTREETVLHADLAQLAATIADLQAKLSAAEASRDKFTSNIKAQKTLIESRTQRTAMHEKLAEQGWDSRAMVLRSLEPLRQDQVDLANYEGSLGEANAAIPVLKNEIAQSRDGFISDNTDAAAAEDRDIADLVQQLKKASLVLNNLSLRAPVSGIVQSLAVTNIGQAVKIGEQLMQIVPDGVPLEIQAYVLNMDIGFVKVGQPVIIKVDTFPFTRYGTISGQVTHVGADAITGAYALMQQKNGAMTPSKGSLSVTGPAQQMSDLVFPVTVVPMQMSIQVDGRAVPLKPGMSVVTEIETEKQRIIGYILYPITRSFRAL